MQAYIPANIVIEGVCNLRDLAGYVNWQGKVIGSRRLWRSDAPHLIDKMGVAQFRAAGLVAVIDLRDIVEIRRAPNPFEDSLDVEYRHIPLLDKLDATAPFANTVGNDRLLSMYCNILTTRQSALALAMEVLANAPPGLVLVHCTVGKDRTGVFVALVLAMLELPLQTIVEDYAVSEARITPFQERIIAQFANCSEDVARLLPLFVSTPATMWNMFGYIVRQYGSLAGYLKLLDPDGELQRKLQFRLLN